MRDHGSSTESNDYPTITTKAGMKVEKTEEEAEKKTVIYYTLRV